MPKKLNTTTQRILDKETSVVLEEERSRIRAFVCFTKKNDTPPIRAIDVDLTLVSKDGDMQPARSLNGEFLVEVRSACTTAQAVYEFPRVRLADITEAKVRLETQTRSFLMQDANFVR